MRKKLPIVSAVTGFLILGIFLANLYYTPDSAQGQAKQITEAEMMAKYSPPKMKQPAKPNVRISRLKNMNIVGEAATVLNVLPINIIDEMKKGKTIVQIAQEKGLSEKEFTQKITNLENKIVNVAVKEGIIPQKQADAIRTGRSDRLKNAMKEKSMDVKDKMPMDMGN